MTEQAGCCQPSSFSNRLQQEGATLRRGEIRTVQINVGLLCNQSCKHCHMNASPQRPEVMSQQTMAQALRVAQLPSVQTVDITGGAPELNPHFRWLICRLSGDDRHVIVRSNLTVLLEVGNGDLPVFLAANKVEVIASLPCYTQQNVDAQRGEHTYVRSLEALRRLNAVGYGREGTGLVLTLTYNPGGPSLPGPQDQLEKDYRRYLADEYGITFTRLLTITNSPIGRFREALLRSGQLQSYCGLLERSFNPATLANVMCRQTVSISWDGFLYDCDFNQALGFPIGGLDPLRLDTLTAAEIASRLNDREIVVGEHCFACTAGAGSSCQGALQA
jgi:radical SAM/Cys-rich protein